MISDKDLYSLAVFLGSMAMLLIVLYHFLEINAKSEPVPPSTGPMTGVEQVLATPKSRKSSAAY
ncbi:MAG: hypothetical protein M1826_005222 [Phylliscum demangeonii]|nr:MAG: hypothetical protein M1826_005222 [Phylliscum demangeonii]